MKKILNSSQFILFVSALYFTILVSTLYWIYGPVLGHITDGDLIYLESLYRDIFIRHDPLNGWLVSKAPYFFPDWVIFFIIRAVTGNYGVAWYLYVVLDFGVLLLVLYGLLKLFYANARNNSLLYSICWGTFLILLLKFTPKGFGPHTLVLPAYHSGALVNGLLILLIWSYSLFSPLRYLRLFLFAVFCGIATLSDEWWIVWFGIPIGLSTLILLMFNRLPWRNNFIFLIAMGMGVIAGELTAYVIGVEKWLYFSQISPGDLSSTLIHQIQVVGRDLLQLFNSSPLLWVLFLASLWFCFRVIKQQKIPQLVAFHIAVLFSFIVPLVFIIFFKLWALWNYRYLHNFIFLPWLVVGLNLFNKQTLEGWNAKYFSLLYLSPPLFLLVLVSKGQAVSFITEDLPTPQTACIDKVAEANHLKFGISEYWHAKNTTETSHAGLLVNQFTYNFDVLHWMNNFHWYLDPKSNEFVNYDFILSAPLTDSSWGTIPALFGTPSDINFCGDLAVLIYKDEKKKYLNQVIHYREKNFFNQINNVVVGKNIVRDGDFISVSHKDWQSVPALGNATLQSILFDKAAAVIGEDEKYYLHWEISHPTSYAYIEQRYPVSTLAGKDLALVFWARSLSGKKFFSSQIYLEPNGEPDKNAVYVDPIQGSPFLLNSQWKKIIVYYRTPASTAHGSAVVRPIFFEKVKAASKIDIAHVQLFSEVSPATQKDNHFHFTLRAADVSSLIAKADRSHADGNFLQEFKFLKTAEAAILINSNFSKKNNYNPALKAELFWRFARIYYQFSKNSVTPDDKAAQLEIASSYAFNAHALVVNSNTVKWWAMLDTKDRKAV